MKTTFDDVIIDMETSYAVIYNDTPRPSIWRHPVKWWRWKPQIIGFVDLTEPTGVDGFVVAFNKNEKCN